MCGDEGPRSERGEESKVLGVRYELGGGLNGKMLLSAELRIRRMPCHSKLGTHTKNGVKPKL